MFGIAGLDPFGLVHAAIGLTAVLLGLGVLRTKKGTHAHRKVGYAYVVAMLLLNGTALAIYDLYGGFGPFHVAALVSLATLFAAYVPVFTRLPRGSWLHLHAHFMCWSYIGLIAAFIAEVTVRVPSMGIGVAAVGATAIAVAAGGALVSRRLPRLIRSTRTVENTNT